jgi:sec-independent protein translocase protein TatB
MFDFAWSEFALIGVVALIAIGPKDMPVAIRTVAQMVKKARRMAGEFQTHVDEMVREANLDEVRGQINEIRSFDFKGAINRAVDSDGSIRKTFSEDPLKTTSFPPTETPPMDAPVIETVAAEGTVIEAAPDTALPGELASPPEPVAMASEAVSVAPVSEIGPVAVEAPAFIPPSIASPPVAPAFIPPGTKLP